MRRFPLLAVVSLAGCGSADVDSLPRAAGPATSPPLTAEPAGRVLASGAEPGVAFADRAIVDGGRSFGVVSRRERVLEVFDARTRRRIARANAGIGPTQLVSDGDNRIYVTDTAGDGLLLFEVRPELRLVRRVRVAGSPYGIAIDRGRERVWITTPGTNEVAVIDIGGGGLRTVGRLPAVRQPGAVRIDERRGRVYVAGGVDGVLQVLDARAARMP